MMDSGQRCVALFLVFLSACASAHSIPSAKSVAPLVPGDRLRVTHISTCCANPSIGIEHSLSADSLVIQAQPDKAQFAIGRSSITQIERWNRGRTHIAAGALIGSLAGAATGGLIGYQSGCGHCDGDWRPLGAISGIIVGGGVGLLTGILIGARQHGFWETVLW